MVGVLAAGPARARVYMREYILLQLIPKFYESCFVILWSERAFKKLRFGGFPSQRGRHSCGTTLPVQYKARVMITRMPAYVYIHALYRSCL